MQKFIYNEQLSAKNYMKSVKNLPAKKLAIETYPFDYVMQKYIYNQTAFK